MMRDGVVTEVDHAAALCRVRSGEMQTDFIPWMTPAAGKVRVWLPPSVGEQVQLLCIDGDLANAVALPGLFSATVPAPSSNPDLTLIQFADSATVAYDSAAHALTANLPAGGTVSIVADGGVRISGPVSIDGDVIITGKAEVSEDVTGGGISLKQHKHGGVQAGGGTSGPPA
ncbi:phage baseplate assembly protein V [Stenotrophomonas maltophilia]|nr:phage baseplate assembly protein V [Stenotrophomonas maltophilia]